MDLEFETRHLILAVHLFVGALFFAFAATLAANGATTGALFRGGFGVVIVVVGLYLYRLRS